VVHRVKHKGTEMMIAVAGQAMQIAMASFAFEYTFFNT